ncbi:TetR/AcrR family transcriptional regulator [Gracilibacillus oryzae]|uniref:TetR/AcrR family transcriptional regulator n=1 Tax=Gracilibacillus oryzae TaxID=1672701 RepID=A0A7C8L4Q2_9BACI|nr:TetR/AcrR family transcriptional regulator [Gracilibacillus oryzae]KAB8126751.1 TetR/AcrR family transcriptional regulator [Gracilibacillus oryzae]
MHEKKEKIIGVAMKLFSEKGFHATSIQQIVQEANVSKGAFYIYFDSKDDLIIAIFQTYTSIVFDKLSKATETASDPYEQLEKQVAVLLTLFRDHKEYLIVHFRENIHIGEKIDTIIFQIHKQGYDWAQERIVAIYGEKVNDCIVDIVINFDGLINSCFKWIAIHNLQFDPERLARTIIKRLDAIIQTCLHDPDSPVFTKKDVRKLVDCSDETLLLIDQLIEKVEELELSSNEKEQITEAVMAIKEETAKEEPKKIIIKTMLAYISQFEGLKQLSQKLSENVLEKD